MIPETIDLKSESLFSILLCELDVDDGPLRFILGEEGRFIDVHGNEWLGTHLISIEDIDFSINGTAPGVNITLAYEVSDESRSLIADVRAYGVEAVRNRDIRFFWQHLERHEEYSLPVTEPVLLTTRRMMNISYSFEGPKQRAISVSTEGPFSLRASSPNGRWTDAEFRRRFNGDPSLEFMPVDSFDEQALFGL